MSFPVYFPRIYVSFRIFYVSSLSGIEVQVPTEAYKGARNVSKFP